MRVQQFFTKNKIDSYLKVESEYTLCRCYRVVKKPGILEFDNLCKTTWSMRQFEKKKAWTFEQNH